MLPLNSKTCIEGKERNCSIFNARTEEIITQILSECLILEDTRKKYIRGKIQIIYCIY